MCGSGSRPHTTSYTITGTKFQGQILVNVIRERIGDLISDKEAKFRIDFGPLIGFIVSFKIQLNASWITLDIIYAYVWTTDIDFS